MGYKVKVQETNRGQKILNIPKVIATLFNIKKGTKCEWELNKGELTLRVPKTNKKCSKIA